MDQISMRRLLAPTGVCAVLTAVLLFAQPTQRAGGLWWTGTVIMGIAPVVGGVLSGIVTGRQDRKHYRPLMEGGIATVGGLLVGLLLWAIAITALLGTEDGFRSLAFAVLFLVLGGPFGFLAGGFTSKKVAWG